MYLIYDMCRVYLLKAFFVLATAFTVFNCYSQDLRLPSTPPSPQSSNLGIYTSIPISYYSGIPDTKISLIDVNLKNVNLPLNISYYSGGIRKSQEATCVGLGWTLNAGGLITRIKRHKDDLGDKGYYLNVNTTSCGDDIDLEPDIFCFNFCGRTGQFVLKGKDDNGKPVIQLLSKEMIKVILMPDNTWELIDENGTKYFFAEKESSKESNIIKNASGSKTKAESYTSSWYITQILNIYNESIFFHYSTEVNRAVEQYTTFWQLKYKYYTGSIEVQYPPNAGGPASGTYTQATMGNSSIATTTLTSQVVQLKNIESPNLLISFQYSSDRKDLHVETSSMKAYKLSQVTITRSPKIMTGSVDTLKEFSFSYDYFLPASGSTNMRLSRLRLLRVQEQRVYSNKVFMKPAYAFSYTSNTIVDKGNTPWLAGFIGSTDGLLNKIVYPTGGFTQYEYELQGNNLGTRIKTIQQFDGQSFTNYREYSYFGEKKFINDAAARIQLPFSQSISWVNNNNIFKTATFYYDNIYSSDQPLFAESSSSYMVGYDSVVELLGHGGIFGKNTYCFYNDNASIYAPPHSGAVIDQVTGVPSMVPLRNGQVKENDIFKYENNTFVKVKSENIFIKPINTFSLSPKRYNGLNCNRTYNINGSWLRIDSVVNINYNHLGKNPIAIGKSFFYDSSIDVRPYRTLTKNSKGETIVSNKVYPRQAAMTKGGVYIAMSQLNFIYPVIEEIDSIGNQIVSREAVDYGVYRTQAPVPLVKKYQNGKGLFEERESINVYDKRGNPIEVKRKDGVYEVYLWGYNSLYPVVKIVGCHYEDVEGVVLQDILDNAFLYSDAQLRYELNKLRTKLASTQAQVWTYTYAPSIGMTSETDPKGDILYYEYDVFGSLALVRNKESKILKRYSYNLAGQILENEIVNYNTNLSSTPIIIYKNIEKHLTLTRNNCGSFGSGGSVTYSVPAGKYFSLISQSDADYKAQDDIYANAQDYANAHGTCTINTVMVTLHHSGSGGAHGSLVNKETNVSYDLSGLSSAIVNDIVITIPEGNYDLTLIPNTQSSPAGTNYSFNIDGYVVGTTSQPIQRQMTIDHSFTISLTTY